MRIKIASLYRRLPILRELCQIRELLGECRGLLTRINDANAVRLVDFELQDHPRFGDPQRLLRFQTQVCSQGGEDGIIHEIFRRIGTTNRQFVEIGVGNGNENNSAFLLTQGWTGFWIDGNDAFRETLRRRSDIPNAAVASLVSFVTAENVVSLFERLDVPEEFDLLSLDIDQNTYYVWESLSRFRPRVVVVEYNAAVPADVDWKVTYDAQRVWDGTQNYGASLKAYELLGKRLGYALVGCDPMGINAFFVRSDLADDQFAQPFTAENHYEPPRYPLSFRRSHPASILDRLDTIVGSSSDAGPGRS